MGISSRGQIYPPLSVPRLPKLGNHGVMANRIAELREAKGLTQPDLAELVGTKATQLGKLERGERRLSDHWAQRIAPHLGVEPHELFMPEGLAGLRFVPVIGEVACGNWLEAIETASERVPSFFGGPNSFALRPVGDSMNLILQGTGYVIVDPDRVDLIDRKHYVILNEEGEATAKTYRASPSRLEPASSNPDHQAIIVGRQRFTVVGQIVEESSGLH